MSNYIHCKALDEIMKITYPLQTGSRWSLWIDKEFQPTLYWAHDYLSMLKLKLMHGSKMMLKLEYY